MTKASKLTRSSCYRRKRGGFAIPAAAIATTLIPTLGNIVTSTVRRLMGKGVCGAGRGGGGVRGAGRGGYKKLRFRARYKLYT